MKLKEMQWESPRPLGSEQYHYGFIMVGEVKIRLFEVFNFGVGGWKYKVIPLLPGMNKNAKPQTLEEAKELCGTMFWTFAGWLMVDGSVEGGGR